MMTITPTDNHVLCGRGKVHMKHPGNIKFAHVIRGSLEEYTQAPSRMDKALVVAKYASYLTDECNLRFIKMNYATQQYTELSSDQIHDKVSHAIRDQIKQNEKAATKNNTVFQKKDTKAKSSPVANKVASGSGLSTPKDNFFTSSAVNSTPIPTFFQGSRIFEIGDVVEEICSDRSNSSFSSIIEEDDSPLRDVFSSLRERCFPLPEQIESSSTATTTINRTPLFTFPEQQNHDPLPVDYSARKSVELEYQDMQRVCAILGEEEEQAEQDGLFASLCADILLL